MRYSELIIWIVYITIISENINIIKIIPKATTLKETDNSRKSICWEWYNGNIIKWIKILCSFYYFLKYMYSFRCLAYFNIFEIRNHLWIRRTTLIWVNLTEWIVTSLYLISKVENMDGSILSLMSDRPIARNSHHQFLQYQYKFITLSYSHENKKTLIIDNSA